MEIKEKIEMFVNSGISLNRIAVAAGINKNTLTSLRKGAHISPKTIEKLNSGLKDIALELYNIAYSDEVSKDEEWEE